MPFLLPEPLRRSRRALAVAVLALSAAPAAHAALQGRDLDGNTATFEAYYDTVLNISWLADANHAKTSGDDADGLMNWEAAKTWAAQLDINGTTGWRLPDVKPMNGSSFQYAYAEDGSTDLGYNITSTQSELAHLYHVTLGNTAYADASGGQPATGGLQNTGPFTNVQLDFYWSNAAFATKTGFAWGFYTYDGFQGDVRAVYESMAWAVHPGDVAAPVPEPQTSAMLLLGLAGLLVALRRRPR